MVHGAPPRGEATEFRRHGHLYTRGKYWELTSSNTSANTPSALGCSRSPVGAVPVDPLAPANMLAKSAKKFAESPGPFDGSFVDLDEQRASYSLRRVLSEST